MTHQLLRTPTMTPSLCNVFVPPSIVADRRGAEDRFASSRACSMVIS